MSVLTHAETTLSPPWRSRGFPESVPLLAQLSHDEIAYLHWLASQENTRDSLIIDLGALAGGSAYCLASGSAAHGPAAPGLISYDSFVASELEVKAGLFRIEPGGSTLGVFNKNLARFESRTQTRAMMVPEFAQGDQLARVYPERASISILFIDCAKQWGVHHTILEAFGPYLTPGATIVQQDFRGPLVYLGLHMYQLRHRTRPVHAVDGGSVGFECVEPITGEDVAALWRPSDVNAHALAARVTEAGAYLDDVSPEPLSAWLTLSAACFCAQQDRPAEAVEFLERAWGGLPAVIKKAPEQKRRRTLASAWAIAVEKAVRQFDHHKRPHEAEIARAMQSWHGTEGLPRADSALRDTLWRQVAARCADIGTGRVALYGAGQHTDWLMHSDFFAGPARIVAIIDDAPERWGRIAGIPVTSADSAAEFDVVIPSSDAHERSLIKRAQQLAESRGARTFPIYTEQA